MGQDRSGGQSNTPPGHNPFYHSWDEGAPWPVQAERCRIQVHVPANRAAAKGAVGFGGRQALSQEPGLEGERREAGRGS